MSFFSDVFEGFKSKVTAPVNLVRNIASGQNVFKSVQIAALQHVGGGSAFGAGGQAVLNLAPAQNLLKGISPLTFGLSGRVASVAETGVRIGRNDPTLSDADVRGATRDNAIVGGAAYVAGSGALGTITQGKVLGAAAASRFLQSGNLAGALGAASGAFGGPDLLTEAAGYIGAQEAPREKEIGAANFVPRIQYKAPVSSVKALDQGAEDTGFGFLPIAVLAGLAVVLIVTKK